jgi:hypothetical protein
MQEMSSMLPLFNASSINFFAASSASSKSAFHKPLGLTSSVYNRLLGSLIYFKEKHHQYIPSGSAMLAQICSQNDNNVPSLGKVKPFL